MPRNFVTLFCALLLPFYGTADQSTESIPAAAENDRELYAPYPPGKIYNVQTVMEIDTPTGVALGFFRNDYGTFVSSAARDCIFFVDYFTLSTELVAGVLDSPGSIDGHFNFAKFSDPTRLAYDIDHGRLYVADMKTGNVRILTFNDEQVHTMKSANGNIISFNFGVQSGGVFPGMDVQISTDHLYVTDTVSLYSVTSSSGLAGLADSAVVTKFDSLTNYMSIHNFPQTVTDGSYVYSVCPDAARNLLYVAIAFSKNVILTVPMTATAASAYTRIKVLAGDQDKTFHMCYECGDAPSAVNGYFGSDPGDVELAFPMHLRYSKLIDSLFISETYPVFSDPAFLWGSQSIRRIDLRAQTIETYVGYDFSVGQEGYGVTGTLGGFVDGEASAVELSYPISIDVTQDVDNDGFPQMAIADLDNNAVRGGNTLRVPTAFPTRRATPAPTTKAQFYTAAPTTASQLVTAAPTTKSQLVTHAPSTTSQLNTAAPSAPSAFVTQAPTTKSQLVTSAPTTKAQLVTGAPSAANQFVTSAPTTSAQFATSAPSAAAVVATGAPSSASQFFTAAPTTVNQFNTAPPTTASQFSTAAPTTAEQFATGAPSAAPVTNAPTAPSAFVTSAPSLASQLVSSAPTTTGQFATNAPTTTAQFATVAPTPTGQFSTSAPTSTEQFSTNSPTTDLGGFISEAPTLASQLVSNVPTTVEQFSTAAPTTTEQFSTSAPTTVSQFATAAPTAVDQFVTSAPTTTEQFVTAAPSSEPVTAPPTKVSNFVTAAPTTTSQFATPAPSRSSEFVTSSPTTESQFATPQPTRAVTTASPTTVDEFFTNAPTTVSQFRTAAPTTADQFVTAAPTTEDQFFTAAPTTVDQFRTASPTTEGEFFTNAPTTTDQFVTNAPTTTDQFVTNVPTTTDQFSTERPTPPAPTVAPTRALNSIQGDSNPNIMHVGGELFISVLIVGSCMCCCLCAYLLLLLLGLLKRDNKKEAEWNSAQAGDGDLDQIPNSHHELLAAIQSTMEAALENGSDSENTSNPMFNEVETADSALGSAGGNSPRGDSSVASSVV